MLKGLKILWLIPIFFMGISRQDLNNFENYLGCVAENLKMPLNELSLKKEDLDFYGYGRYRLKLFDFLVFEPPMIEQLTRTISRIILQNADSLWALSYFSWARIDEGVRRGLIERPDEVLVDSVKKLSNFSKELSKILANNFNADTINLSLPGNITIGLFMILSGIRNSLEWIEKGRKNLNDKDIEKVINGLIEYQEEGISNTEIEGLLDNTDFKALASGSVDLSYILQTAIDLMRDSSPLEPLKIETKYGTIALGTPEDDEYEPLPYLLIIDFGGNDIYKNSLKDYKKYPISIIIDYQGNDKYIGMIGWGTGILGYGYVIDLSGDDEYSSEKFGLGTGLFGHGIILDLEGNDKYNTEIYGVGAGLFGTGVVSDLSGNDIYKGFQGTQGFGFVKGCGLIVDKEGNDTYIARDDTIKYPSPQTDRHNTSLSQGCGFGIRADFTDGHSLAGGVGMLIDEKGDDRYSCGVFGQGCGYWFGLGFLLDFEGNDEYKGIWYVQGAGAHFALGFLLDSLGNDRYIAEMNMAQGAGHDFTLGLLFDYEGDDYFDAPNLSLGAGNANGMGVFVDYKGNDEYNTHGGIVLGGASTAARGSPRDFMKTIGIFIDGGGKDKYKEARYSDKKTWFNKSPLEPPLKTEISIGIDF